MPKWADHNAARHGLQRVSGPLAITAKAEAEPAKPASLIHEPLSRPRHGCCDSGAGPAKKTGWAGVVQGRAGYTPLSLLYTPPCPFCLCL